MHSEGVSSTAPHQIAIGSVDFIDDSFGLVGCLLGLFDFLLQLIERASRLGNIRTHGLKSHKKKQKQCP